jgi:hypothetical protein
MAYEEARTIPPLSVRAAASRLGISTWSVYKAIDRGELRPVTRDPIQVLASDVEALRLKKQDQAIEWVGADRLLQLARDVRRQLHPPATAPGPRGHKALEGLSERVKAAFGMPLLHGASMPDGAVCRWCAARVAARMLGIPVSDRQLSGQVGIALLGGPTCERDRGLVRARMTELGARVHPGGVRPSEGRVEAAAGTRPPAPSQSAVRAVAAVEDAGGKALVQRRLREVRARLKTARRTGDTQYAFKLQRQLQSLTADASVVDGRARSAAGPAGVKRCGTPVGVRCSCHANDGWVKRSAQ